MDLAQEFKNILTSYGHNVYLYRRSNNKGEGPYNKVDIKYLTPLEKWTIYRRPLRTGATASSDGFQRLDQEGMSTNYDMCFYFQPESDVKTSDIVIEDTPGEIERRQMFNVAKAVPYYIGAQLVYYAAYCDKISPTER
jgi:hypothetical protein